MIVFEEKFLTPEQIAEQLQVDKETVERLLRKGRMTGTKVGKLWRVSQTDFAKFLEENRKGQRGQEEGGSS